MNLSIRIRLILAMNLLVVGVGVAVGWAGVAVAGRVIERRLVDKAAVNAAGLFATMRLPLSDGMMSRLRQVLDAEVAAGPIEPLAIAASSLPEDETLDLKTQLARGPLPRRIVLAGHAYLVGTAAVTEPAVAPEAGPRSQLYLLVPEAQVVAAKQASERTLTWVTLAAIGVATLLAIGLSTSILRPIRRLAMRMDALSEQAADEKFSSPKQAPTERAPAEIVLLATSFERLLARLDEVRGKLARSARLATLGQLSASMAHELRNPLSGIRMNARVLADELAKAGAPDSSLDRIIREADRMNLYLDELLGLASGDARQEVPHDLARLPRVKLDEVAESVLSLLERRCQHAGVTVHRQWDPSACEVRAEETQIRQVILNLVLNALDAMPVGGAVTLSTRPGDAAGTVRFCVSDAGKGVHVPEGTDLFEPFVTTKSGGVGLGLYVCRRNIDRHRGTLGYESSDHGATFWFELPAVG